MNTNTKALSGIEEAREAVQNKFKTELSCKLPESVLHLDASTPYASMRVHQAIVTLSALENTASKIVVFGTSAGFYSEHSPVWNLGSIGSLEKWELAKESAYFISLHKISCFAPAFLGGLSQFAEMRRSRLLNLWRKINPRFDQNRLVLLDLATHQTSCDQNFLEMVETAPERERVGKIPCPYCSYKLSKKTGKTEFVYHFVKNHFGLSVENYHCKCPLQKILASLKNSSLAEVIQQTGFALTGRFACRWFSARLSSFGVDAIMIKDFANASGVMRAAVETISSPLELFVSTRTECRFDMKELEGLESTILSGIISKHRVLSDGSIFNC